MTYDSEVAKFVETVARATALEVVAAQVDRIGEATRAAQTDMVRQIAAGEAKVIAAEIATQITGQVIEQATARLAAQAGEAAAIAARKAIEQRLGQVAAFRGRR